MTKLQAFMILVLNLSACTPYLPSMDENLILPPGKVERTKELARTGDREAYKRILDHYMIGLKDGESGFGWIRLYAMKGDPDAQAMYGVQLYRDAQCPEEAAVGLLWLHKGKENGATASEGFLEEIDKGWRKPGYQDR